MCARAKHTHIDTETSLIWCTCTLNKIKQLLCGVFFFDVFFTKFYFFHSAWFIAWWFFSRLHFTILTMLMMMMMVNAHFSSSFSAHYGLIQKVCATQLLFNVKCVFCCELNAYGDWWAQLIDINIESRKYNILIESHCPHHFCYSQAKAGTQSYINYFTLLIFDEMTKKYV